MLAIPLSRPASGRFASRALGVSALCIGLALFGFIASVSAQENRPSLPPSLGGSGAEERAPAKPIRPSACYAYSRLDDVERPVRLARFVEGLQERQAGVTFIGHATFLIESPEGVSVATDYAGYAGPNVTPDAVTMNGAHSTHHTAFPDPAIPYVFRGWREDGEPADHYAKIEDLRIRSVSTDTVGFGDVGVNRNGNSIFVFEIDDLCIGHLGHLHHVPTREQLAQIGFLDVVMAPVDGGYTLSLPELVTTLEALRARVVIPMHAFGSYTLERFLTEISASFPVVRHDGPTMVVSKLDLPKSTTVIVLPPMSGHPDPNE